MGFITLILIIAITILLIVAFWKILVKAGRPGWISIIPFYNFWTLSEISSKPAWWGLAILFSVDWLDSKNAVIFRLFSLICFVIYVQISQGLAHNFKKSTIFGVVLAVFPFIGYPILGYGQATYKVVKTKQKSKT
jgi:hypothetical protein